MKVTILTPEAQLYEGHAKAIILPGLDGQFEILDGAGSNTRTTGTITMTPGDMIQFIWNGSDWAQVSYSNNN